MSRSLFLSRFALLVGAGVLLSGAALRADDKAKDKKDEAPTPGASSPGKEHQLLKREEGTWDATIKMTMDPSKPPVESKGTEVCKMICNGLWQDSQFKGEFGGQPFEGHSLTGYDTAKKKYTGVWVDSMGTYLTLMEGDFDKAGKVLTLTMEMQGENGKPVKSKMVTTFKDEDHHTSTMSMIGDDGKEVSVMTIEYKRKK
jgi:hypothetical protein